MNARFRQRPGSSLDEVQAETRLAFERLGDVIARRLPNRVIGPNETRIAHGLDSVPSQWHAVSAQHAATILETRRPDRTFLYLRNAKPAASVAEEDWGAAVKRRMCAWSGMPEGRASFVWESFTFPGDAADDAAAPPNFGERWRVTVGGGGAIAHVPQGGLGAPIRGGICSLYQPAGPAAVQMKWRGVGLFQAAADERWGIAFRVRHVGLPNPINAGDSMNMGVIDAGNAKRTLFGFAGTTSTTLCRIQPKNGTVIATTYPITSLNAEREIVIIRRPDDAGTPTIFYYIDGALLIQAATDTSQTDLVPIFTLNAYEMQMDDVAFVTDGALGGRAVATLPTSAVGTSGAVTVDIEVR